jgi:hypothetical protein
MADKKRDILEFLEQSSSSPPLNKKRGGLNQTVNRFHNNVCNFMQQDDCSTKINQLGKQY